MGSIFDLSSRKPSRKALEQARKMAEVGKVSIYDTPTVHLLLASERQVKADKRPPKNTSIYNCSIER